jgi:hypothetical protein
MSGQDGGFLDGVKVIEAADERGECSGKNLAGLDADVARIEPRGGEMTRTCGPFHTEQKTRMNRLTFSAPYGNRARRFGAYHSRQCGQSLPVGLVGFTYQNASGALFASGSLGLHPEAWSGTSWAVGPLRIGSDV